MALKRGVSSVSVVAALCFSFYQQLLLPATLSVTTQLSANKSSDLLPALSHPLSPAGLSILAPLSPPLSLSLSVYLTSCHLRPHFLPLPPLSRPAPRGLTSSTCCDSRTLDKKKTFHPQPRKYSTISGCTGSSVRGAHVHDGVCRRV